MKIVQSFWSKPALITSEDSIDSISSRCKGGWLHANYYWMSWALSCLKLREHYDQVELVTDEIGKSILIDKLKLPYSKVTVCLDQLKNYPTKLWALGKLHAYSIQNQPFIHVDSDVYIWKKFGPEIDGKELIAQSIEDNRKDFYNPLIQQSFNYLEYIPEVLTKYCKKEKVITAVNAGILGGTDLNFIRQYTREAFSFVDRNLDQLPNLDMGEFNTIYEQVLFYYLAKDQGKKVSYYFNRIEDGMAKMYYLNFLPSRVNYIHVIGMYKRNLNICRQVEARLSFEFPQYYNDLRETLNIPHDQSAIQQNENLKSIYLKSKEIDKKFLFSIPFQLSKKYDYGIVHYEKPKNGHHINERALYCNHKSKEENKILPLSELPNEILLQFNQPKSCNDIYPEFRKDKKYDYLNEWTLKSKIYKLIAYNYIYQDMLDLA